MTTHSHTFSFSLLFLCSILLRPKTRWLHNINDIGSMLLRTGLIGAFDSYAESPYLKIASFESLSFREQVVLVDALVFVRDATVVLLGLLLYWIIINYCCSWLAGWMLCYVLLCDMMWYDVKWYDMILSPVMWCDVVGRATAKHRCAIISSWCWLAKFNVFEGTLVRLIGCVSIHDSFFLRSVVNVSIV